MEKTPIVEKTLAILAEAFDSMSVNELRSIKGGTGSNGTPELIASQSGTTGVFGYYYELQPPGEPQVKHAASYNYSGSVQSFYDSSTGQYSVSAFVTLNSESDVNNQRFSGTEYLYHNGQIVGSYSIGQFTSSTDSTINPPNTLLSSNFIINGSDTSGYQVVFDIDSYVVNSDGTHQSVTVPGNNSITVNAF